MSQRKQQVTKETIQRWEGMYHRMERVNDRQRQSIERLLAMVMIGVNALTEIRDGGSVPDHAIAVEALARIEAEREKDRSASTGNPEESTKG
jgi:hypothetical protein